MYELIVITSIAAIAVVIIVFLAFLFGKPVIAEFRAGKNGLSVRLGDREHNDEVG
jgi:hypothetical protein